MNGAFVYFDCSNRLFTDYELSFKGKDVVLVSVTLRCTAVEIYGTVVIRVNGWTWRGTSDQCKSETLY